VSIFRKQRRKQGLVGVEVRADSLGVAVANGKGEIRLLDYLPASPAGRAEVLSAWVKENRLYGIHCNLVLSPDCYSSQLLEKPAVDDRELAEAMRWKVKDMLDYSLEDAVIDVFEFPEDALRGKPALVNVVAARKALIKELIQLVKASGLRLQSIDITELALRNLVHPVAEPDQVVALVLMRETTGMVLLVKNDTVYFSRRLNADMQGLSDPAERDRIGQQLALEVQRSMDYFESQMGQKAPRSLLVSAAINEPELINHLGDILGVDITNIPEQSIGISDDQLAGSHSLVACGGAMRKRVVGRPLAF